MNIAAQVVGFRMWGPPPIGTIEMNCPRGFVALGGPNGAGKSTLLHALGEVLGGTLVRLNAADVVFRLFDVDDGQDDLGSAILEALQMSDFEGTTAKLITELMRRHLGVEGERLLAGTGVLGSSLASDLAAQCVLVLSFERGSGLQAQASTGGSTKALWHIGDTTVPGPNASLASSTATYFVQDPPVPDGAPAAFQLLDEPGELPVKVLKLDVDIATTEISRIIGVEWLSPTTSPGERTTRDFSRRYLAWFIRRMGKDDAVRNAWLTRGDQPGVIDDPDALASLLEIAQVWIRSLSRRANEVWTELRPDQAQELRCVVADPGSWKEGSFFEWQTRDATELSWYSTGALSAGLSRWAGLAIGSALLEVPFPDVAGHASTHRVSEFAADVWWLMDEPELGLHRTAERQVADNLATIARERGITVVTATHSPAVMAAADTVLRVSRRDRGLAVERIDSPPEQLRKLGLDTSDLLGWYRTFFFVEGHHDAIALQGFLPGLLTSDRVKIIVLSGALNLPGALASQFFLDSTEAGLVALIDDVSPVDTGRLWTTAIEVLEAEGFNQMASHVREVTKPCGTEGKAIKDFIVQAVTMREHRHRVQILGLPQSDVLLYLHPPYLSPAMPPSWQEVQEMWAKRYHKAIDPSWKPDKKWIETTFDVSINDSLPQAVTKTRSEFGVPHDFQVIADAIRLRNSPA